MKKASITLVIICILASCKGNQGDNTGIRISTSPSTTTFTSPAITAEDNLVTELSDSPDIRFISSGSILPSSGDLELLFSSISYAKAEVRVQKIYSNNILQFLQYADYEVKSSLENVARQVVDTTIVLGDPKAQHLREKKIYGLSLDELIKPEPGAIYHVEIRGREPLVQEDFWDSDWYFGDCETYDKRHVFLLASKLALIAKEGDDSGEVFVCDILSGKPVSGAKVKVYDSVQQELCKGSTDKDGRFRFPASQDAFFVTARCEKDFAYLALKNEKSLSTSNFDVDGTIHDKGMKAYIFGERGVWRPGDTIHLSVITMTEGKDIPEGYPVTAKLRNPDGQLAQTITVKYDGSHICTFPFVTEPDAPTGRWSVTVEVGGQSFSKGLRVETIKPNKLDIDLKFDDDILIPETSCVGEIAVNWLYGAPGSHLKVQGQIDLSSCTTSFKGFEGYDFKDDARSFPGNSLQYLDMVTDEEGKCRINTGISLNKAALPGMLDADFTITAFEQSGEFSTGTASFKMSPFDVYVGMNTQLNKSVWGESYIKAGKSQNFDIATVDRNGKPKSVQNLLVQVFHVDWSWWWNSSDQIASYMASEHKEEVFTKRISTKDGKGSFSYDWKDDPNGLYYIRVSDSKGGHASSMLCEVYEDNSSTSSAASGSTRLSTKLSKESYKVGETARITIPSAKGSRALVSLEKGGRILSTSWADCYEGSTDIQIPITADMLPNVYAFITLVQPHKNSANDAPIRLYGVQNINVEDGNSQLKPVVDIADEARPESTLNFKVKEQDGRAMSYVVAIVDEGLLSLTGFKTPNAWKSFYAKEALRTRTWDLYDEVIGAYGGRIEQLFAVGGDDEYNGKIKRKGADRFTPVVAFMGPFELKAGKTAKHSIDIPQYIGSLRAMVIATDGKAQGSCQKNVNVNKPLMVQASLPRTLCTGERIKLPVSVIAMKDKIGKVDVSVQTDGMFSIAGPDKLTVKMDEEGQEIVYFELESANVAGIGHVSVTAQSSADKSLHSTEIDILNPNPELTRCQSVLLASGESKNLDVELFGMEGSNSVSVEFSSIPAIDLNRRLKYLLEYPYGCVEQTISAGFPQLFLDRIMECDENVRARSIRNVEATIRRLQSFRLADGTLSYWPGAVTSSSFGTVYALHFLQEAENMGYAVASEFKASLINSITKQIAGNSAEDYYVRAYALYALAEAGKPARSAMNNLREKVSKMDNGERIMLAAAFAADGKKEIAAKLSEGTSYTDKNYICYGSPDRNRAVALKTLLLMGREAEAFRLATDIAERLNDSSCYMSTQSTAWSLYAMCDYARTMAGGVTANVYAEGKNIKFVTDRNIVSKDIAIGKDESKISLKLSNTGTNSIYAVISSKGIPAAGEEKAFRNGLNMQIDYYDENGSLISVDTLSRGRNFKAVVTVTNTGSSSVKNIALAQKFPSGWEIRNQRVHSDALLTPAGLDYQDIRDDRVNSFFELAAGASVKVSTKLTTAYPGRFYLPAVNCEAMYDSSISANLPGRWVEVK